MNWNDVKILVPFGHLSPFDFQVDLCNLGELKVRVSFSHHCFTDECPTTTKQKFLEVAEDIRYFCFNRYGRTFELPEIIKRTFVDNRKLFLTNDRVKNVILIMLPGIDHQHCIYFDIKREAKKKITIYVRSSYIRYDGERYQSIPNTMKAHKLLEKIKKGENLPQNHKRATLKKEAQ